MLSKPSAFADPHQPIQTGCMFKLQRFLSIANLVAILFALTVFSWLHYEIEKEKGVKMGQRENVAFSSVLQNSLRKLYLPLLTPTTAVQTETRTQQIEALSRAIEQHTQRTAVLKLKIYDLQGRIVFSTHTEEITERSSPESVVRALAEGIYTKPKTLSPGHRFGDGVEDILETYIPIVGEERAQPIGVFEVYSDITEVNQDLRKDVIVVTAVQVAIMLVLYLILLMVGRRAEQIIHSQDLAKRDYLQQIEEANANLERRVAERTEELTQANLELQEQMLERSRADERGRKFFLAVEQSPASVVMTDAAGQIEYVNPRFSEITGYTPQEVLGRNPGAIKSGENDPADYQQLWSNIAKGRKWQGELLNRKKSGELHWEEVTITPIRNDQGVITHHLAVKEDITEAKRSIEKLRVRDRALEASQNAICILEALGATDTPIVYVNPSFTRITGYAASEVVGKSLGELLDSEECREQEGRFYHALESQMALELELICQHKNGDAIWVELNLAPVFDEKNVLTHYVVALDDISERKDSEAQLLQLATHDTLTGLPNRGLVLDRLEQALLHARRNGEQVGVLFIDLDHFKLINDSLGHSAGDQLLQAVAERLTRAVRECDTVGRQSGDEFVVILSEIDSASDEQRILDRVLACMQAPFGIADQEVNITCSIGISLFPDHGEDTETLFRHADIAMYQAKEDGRNNYARFQSEMGEALSDKARMIEDLRHAVERGEFVLHYQPKVSLVSGEVVGAEALIRWRHPAQGMVQPNRFITVAEESGLILPIGEWVLNQACADANRWREMGYTKIPVSVNLSARQLQRQDVLGLSELSLKRSGLPANCLDLEITESIVMENPDRTVRVLQRLRELGVTISVDDFGTGYSSLAYLKRFPIDRVKIDQSFVQNITNDPDDAAIAQATISMSHSLRCKVVAEGVETPEQLAYLREHKCDEMQGYFFSRPLPLAQFMTLLDSGASIDLAAADLTPQQSLPLPG